MQHLERLLFIPIHEDRRKKGQIFIGHAVQSANLIFQRLFPPKKEEEVYLTALVGDEDFAGDPFGGYVFELEPDRVEGRV